jgi:hypothetical protein
MLVLSGRYLGFLPCHIAERFVLSHEMRAILPQTYAFESQHFVAHRRGGDKDPVVAAFLKNLAKAVANP